MVVVDVEYLCILVSYGSHVLVSCNNVSCSPETDGNVFLKLYIAAFMCLSVSQVLSDKESMSSVVMCLPNESKGVVVVGLSGPWFEQE